MISEQDMGYIEQEVKIRVHEERFKYIDEMYTDKFNDIDKRFDSMDAKLNLIMVIVIGSVIIPVALHFLRLI